MKGEIYKRTTIHLTQSLYDEIKKRAEEQRRSLNSEVVSLVESVMFEDVPPDLHLIKGGRP